MAEVNGLMKVVDMQRAVVREAVPISMQPVVDMYRSNVAVHYDPKHG